MKYTSVSKLIAAALASATVCSAAADRPTAGPSNARGTIALTTVSYPRTGIKIVEVGVPMDLATYYAEHGLVVSSLPADAGSISATLGPAPSVPPPPAPGDVRPDVGSVIEIIQQNGWTSTTTYTRDVQPNPNGGYSDGPWQFGGNSTQPSGGGGGGGCNPKTSDQPCASPF